MKKFYPSLKAFSGLSMFLVLALISPKLSAQDKYILGHPGDVNIDEGFTGSVFFRVDVDPDVKLKFQWSMKVPGGSWKEMTDEISSVLVLPFKEPADPKLDGTGFQCVVDDGSVNETTVPAYLWVAPPRKVITGHPVDVVKEAGYTGEYSFSVETFPGVTTKTIWFKRFPGGEWKEAGTGPQLIEKAEKLDLKLNGTAYRCLVEYKDGKEYSDVAYLWVKLPRRYILTDPVDVTKPEGFSGYINFDITTEGIGLTYQWQYALPGTPWENIEKAVKPVLEFPVKGMGPKLDGTAFRCVVTDEKKNKEYSREARLYMEQARRYILLDPEDVTEEVGYSGKLHFYIKYDDGGSELKFYWQEKKPGGAWTDITVTDPNKPELYYPVEKLTSAWSGYGFRCAVIDGKGYVEYSKAAYLYVHQDYFLASSGNVTLCEGSAGTAKFGVKVVDGVTLALQWQVKPAGGSAWKNISGATSTVYAKEFTEVPLSYNGTAFRCMAVDTHGGTDFSDIAFLYVTALPVVTGHPESQEKMVGEAVTFNVAATGAKPFAYQWLKDGVPLTGANASSLTLFPLAEDDAGDYSCVVTNSCTATGDTSDAATLIVNAPEFDDGWFEQEIVTSKDLTDVKFTGTNSGWITVSNSNFAYKTADGGKTWDLESITDSKLWSAVFTTDADHVWIAGEDLIKYTTNGNSEVITWNDGTFNSVLSSIDLSDLFFADASNGWAVGGNGLILNTTDGGSNWYEQHSGSKIGYVTDVDLSAVHFFDADTGWVVGDLGKILKTYDGGTTWEVVPSGTTENLMDVCFIDAWNGWAVGGDEDPGTGQSVLLKTSNGGGNWTAVSTHHSFVGNEDLTGVFFYDADHGWITTSDGQILRTNDGGTTWYSQASGTDEPLNAIDFADYDNGWVVGNTGTILRTAYSGCLLPTVSLFEDKEFCASVDYQLVADSFQNNVDCSYDWSTGETTGSIDVTTSGKYYVTVSSVCGVEVSDTVNIVLYPLPEADAGSDQEMCAGDSVQLLAAGGIQYSWNNQAYLNDANIQNPKAGPPEGNTDFIVTVTDNNLCQNTDTVTVSVYPIPTSTFTAPEAICDGDSAAITYTGSASGAANYSWDFGDGSTVMSGEGAGPYGISWDATGEHTVELVVEENGCTSDTARTDLDVYAVPTAEFTVDANVCGDSIVTVTYTGSAGGSADFDWNFDGPAEQSGTGSGPYEISWSDQGTKLVSLVVTENNCPSEMSTGEVQVSTTYEGTGICLVTVDPETGKNLVIWEKPEDVYIESFNVYRETDVSGQYELLANVPYDNLSVYTDMSSQPSNQQHLYKISAVDSCGESELSPYHKTLLLQYVSSVGGVNMNWGEYEIENGDINFKTYIIYRGTDSTHLEEIGRVSASSNLYVDTDPDALAGKRWYRIAGVKPDTCYPSVSAGGTKASTGPYSHSLSNLDDNKLQGTGVRDVLSAENNLRVFPNPFRDKVQVEYLIQQPSGVKIEVYNILGVRILELENTHQMPGVYNYEIRAEDLDGSSIYYLRFSVDGRTSVKKLIPAR